MYNTIADQLNEALQNYKPLNRNTVIEILSAHVFVDEEDEKYIINLIEHDKKDG